MDEDPQNPAAGSALCVACGLCCSGALFSHAKAEPDELERLAGFGLQLTEVNGAPRFRLPCHHLAGTACTIYQDRFTICRSFRCELLKRLDRGEIGHDEAERLVGEAQAMVAKAESIGAGLFDERHPRIEAGPGEAPRDYLELVALELFLNKHFRRPGEEQPK